MKTIVRKYIKNIRNPKTGEIWCLHRVLNRKSVFVENSELEISPVFLENKIKQYLQDGYRFVSIDEVLQQQSNYRFPWQKKFLNISFDDGFEDIYTHAFPLFRKYQIPFTIYITTDLIEQNILLWWLALEEIVLKNDKITLSTGEIFETVKKNEKQKLFSYFCNRIYEEEKNPAEVFQELFSDYASFFSTGIIMALSWSQLSEMCSSRLCTIGSHTVSHPVLTKIPENRLDYEIVGSKNILEQKLNIPIEHFSYPHSFWNEQIKQKVQQAGYKTAVLGYGGSCRFNKTDNFLLPRNYILEK